MSNGGPVDAVREDSNGVTRLLIRWSQGDHSALEQPTPIIYDDLLRLARARLRREYGGHALEPTALVHEAYLRLTDQTNFHAENRTHFYAIAANTMRRVLTEYARKRMAKKRGAGVRVTLQTDMDIAEQRAPDVIVLDDALRRLAEIDERKSRAIELKFLAA